MRSFEQLTKRGQARRLKSLVLKALNHYEIEVSDIQLVGLFTNVIFRLRTASGRSYIMRICRPGWRTERDLISEIMWLQALSQDTDIRIPDPLLTQNGDCFVELSVAGVPEARRCVVMRWLPGALLATRLNENNMAKMGVLFARLHEHGATFIPPDGFSQRKMDSIYARDEPDVLFSAANRDAFPPGTRAILGQTSDSVQEAFSQLYSGPRSIQVIHNDLHHENIKIYRGKLCPFDFEDTIWGFPVQDIAMALQDLMIDVTGDEYDPFQRAFRDGYESLQEWPEEYDGQIDTFRAGRMLWVANYVARYQRIYLREHVEWLARQFKRYLESGMIRKT